MLHEALRRAGHVVPASEISVRTRRAPQPMRPLAYAIVLGVVTVASAGGALVLYQGDGSHTTAGSADAATVQAAAAPPIAESTPPLSEPTLPTVSAPSAAIALARTAAPVASAPPAITTASPAAPTEPPPDIGLLLARGDSLLRTGDLVAARLFYQRAAEQGDSAGALGVAKTYDPTFLEQAGFRNLRGDPAAAVTWYRKAAAAGDPDAVQRLERLLAAAPAR